ncbi:MAG TPA: aminoglycoside adenylyltransferase domain-containing protein [Gaiellaceae bacterium]
MGGSQAERRRAGSPVDAYLAELAERARTVLGGQLVGVYAGGSLALGAYEQGRSDLDVAVVVSDALERRAKEQLVAVWRHEALPCPARGLELVVYSREAVASGGVEADFELNLNTGRAMPFRADFELDPAIGSHWFAIDRAILRDHAIALVGPPAADVFAAIPRELLLSVVAESLRWHEGGDALGDDAVLNACRALRYALADEWSSKPAAGRWALDRDFDTETVKAALAARDGGPPVDPARAAAFVASALSRI